MERHRRPIISSLWLTAHTFLILWAYIIHPSIWMLKRDLLRLLASACFYFVCGCTRSAVRSDETTRATLRRHASLHMMDDGACQTQRTSRSFTWGVFETPQTRKLVWLSQRRPTWTEKNNFHHTAQLQAQKALPRCQELNPNQK